MNGYSLLSVQIIVRHHCLLDKYNKYKISFKQLQKRILLVSQYVNLE